MGVRLLLAVAVAFGLAAPCAAAPLEAYGKLPNVEAVAISPDGTRLGFVSTNGEERRIVIRNLVDGTTKVLSAGMVKIRGIQWAGSDHLLIEKTSTYLVQDLTGPRREYGMVFDYNLSTGQLRQLLADVKDGMNVVYGTHVREVGGRTVVVAEGVHFMDSMGRLSLFAIDLSTDRSTLIKPGFEHTTDWVVGQDGNPLAETEYEPDSGKWVLRVKSPAGWQIVKTETAMIERPQLLGLGRDGVSAIVAEPAGDKAALREIDPSVGAWPEPFLTAAFASAIHDPAHHNLIGFHGLAGDEDVYEFLNPADATIWRSITKAYKGTSVGLTSWSDDHSKIVLQIDSPAEGPSYALVDLKARRADPIGYPYEGVTAADVAPVRAIQFKAKDGLQLSGYLTLPRGREAKALPLVVLAHGGPAVRDEPGFDWWSQAMASRGYAVLRVNYRGSDGFGEEFLEAGFGQWGRKMQTDLSDGVRYLVGQNLVDAHRVCIVGASYGGYAALAGAALDPGVYRCAADVSGLSDLRQFLTWSKTQHSSETQRYWKRFMGAEDPKSPVLDEISPAMHVDRITIPILMVHGKDDTVVPLAQTSYMERALKAAGKPVETVIMPGEDHWLSQGETRLKMLQSVVAFLEKNNPPQ